MTLQFGSSIFKDLRLKTIVYIHPSFSASSNKGKPSTVFSCLVWYENVKEKFQDSLPRSVRHAFFWKNYSFSSEFHLVDGIYGEV